TQPAQVSFINVTTTIHDENTLPNDLLLRSDDYVGGPFQATYASSSCGGKCGLLSKVDINTGAWQLLLTNQTTRRVWVTLSHLVGNSPTAPAPDGYYYAGVEIFSRCWDSNNVNVPFLSIPQGASQNRCNFGLDFAGYKLVMGPAIPGLARNTTGTG